MKIEVEVELTEAQKRDVIKAREEGVQVYLAAFVHPVRKTQVGSYSELGADDITLCDTYTIEFNDKVTLEK